jgi:DNA helicase-2/ATP-dependent DNA helicase PcrA
MTAATAALARRASPGVRAALRGQEPTEEQWDAITAPAGPVHLIAGAGSGKTAVMAARIVHLVEHHGIRPASILGLTFTNKAAAELEERVRLALGSSGGVEAGTVSTYHAFAAEVVQTFGIRIGVEPDADLLSDAQQYQILLGILEQERFEHLQVRSPGRVIAAALALASACADHMVDPAAITNASAALVNRAEAGEDLPRWLVDNARERTELGRLVERYRAEKLRRGRIDFGDQVARAVELVEQFDEIAAALRARYPHVLLDEYQDTNVAQRRLMQRLCPPGASIMAVGDARQAIYAFRGATMYNLLSFAEHFPRAGDPGAARSLSVNFRSGRRILELANAAIEPIPAERRGGHPLVAPPANGEGAVHAALLADQFGEAAFVAGRILAARRDGLPSGEVPAWREIAVLVRSRRLLGPLREALEQHDIPVEVVGLSGLLETPEIVDLVSMLRVLDDPGANVALTRLLLGPRWRIGYRHIYRLTKWCSRHNWRLREGMPGEDPDPGDVSFALAEALDHLDEIDGLDAEALIRLRAFRAELRALRHHVEGPLLDLVQAVLEHTGVWAEIEASPDRRAASARQNLATFLDRVAAFAPVEGEPSLRAFLAYLDAVEEAAEAVEATQPAPADSVKLMTVHQAKGLEFPMVVVAGLAAGNGKDGTPVHGIFPNVRVDSPLNARGLPYELREDAAWLPRYRGNYREFKAALTERALEDERRLFYVAATRAKQLLLLTAAWWYQGSDRRPKGPGPFWLEAAAHPAVDVLERAPEQPASPLADRLAARRSWPPAARRPEEVADPLFAEGYAAAVTLARERPEALVERLGPGERDAFEAALQAQRHLVELARPPAPRVRPPQTPRVLSVTQVLTYARCPRAFYWSVVRPLPGPPKPAARLGTVVHRLLERRTRALPDLADVEPAEWSPPTTADPGLVERAQRSFRRTRFAAMPPPETEVGVVLRSGPWVLRGRIDALYRTPEGVELVDWKTGRVEQPAGDGVDQLGLYALALRELGALPGGRCRATYCHLGGEAPVERARELDPAALDRQRAELEALLVRIGAGDWSGCGARDCEACARPR